MTICHGLRTALLVAAAAAIALPVAARADRGDRHERWHGDIRHFDRNDMHVWRGGHWIHSRHGGRLGWWWVAGGLWYFYPRPVYPYPNPYVPPVVVQSSPPVYVEQPQSAVSPPAPAAQTWYYCAQAQAYYPYVAECPGGWQPVPATPPR